MESGGSLRYKIVYVFLLLRLPAYGTICELSARKLCTVMSYRHQRASVDGFGSVGVELIDAGCGNCVEFQAGNQLHFLRSM